MTPSEQAKLSAFNFLCKGGIVKICTGCGSVLSLSEIKESNPGARSCCPERKMVQHRLFTADMLREREEEHPRAIAQKG